MVSLIAYHGLQVGFLLFATRGIPFDGAFAAVTGAMTAAAGSNAVMAVRAKMRREEKVFIFSDYRKRHEAGRR
jgi:hypothetical protein